MFGICIYQIVTMSILPITNRFDISVYICKFLVFIMNFSQNSCVYSFQFVGRMLQWLMSPFRMCHCKFQTLNQNIPAAWYTIHDKTMVEWWKCNSTICKTLIICTEKRTNDIAFISVMNFKMITRFDSFQRWNFSNRILSDEPTMKTISRMAINVCILTNALVIHNHEVNL